MTRNDAFRSAGRPTRSRARALLAAATLILQACASPAGSTPGATPPGPAPSPRSAADAIHLLHFNDVYEITPVEGGRSGGLARVATLRQALRDSFPSLTTTLGGDFLSPSALGTARVGGERLSGRQMVSVLNAVGLDVAVLGNHEFDVGRQAFLDRLGRARFIVLGANVSDSIGHPFPKVLPHTILTIPTRGRAVRVGIFGVVIPSNQPSWARIADPIETGRREAALLRDSADVIIALTHLSVDDDGRLVAEVPGIDVVLGGHEHENYTLRRGAGFVPVLKADANVRTVQVVTIHPRVGAGSAEVSSRLVPITENVAEDSAVAREVARWVDSAFAGFARDGFRPRDLVAHAPVALDGREATVRMTRSVLTDVIGAALRREVPGAEISVFNGGSIRIDDVLPPGPVTQYDVIRMLPFGGRVVEARIQGALLRRVLAQGERNAGQGGYLQRTGVEGTAAAGWTVAGASIDDARWYRVAITDYLLTGSETGLEFLKRDAETAGLEVVAERRDIRQAVIDELHARWP